MTPRIALAAAVFLSACATQPNIYMPPERRRPLDGPDPREFSAEHRPAEALAKTRGSFRLTPPAQDGLKLRVVFRAPDGGATVGLRVNVRDLGQSSCAAPECRIEKAVPPGTFISGTAALVDFESSAPVVLVQASLQP
jgi:hypothetical protein